MHGWQRGFYSSCLRLPSYEYYYDNGKDVGGISYDFNGNISPNKVSLHDESNHDSD